eukprot:2785781-Pleurochrysis_carterae.AAC.4
MARRPIYIMVFTSVATGTTLNIAADWIHLIGSQGILRLELFGYAEHWKNQRDGACSDWHKFEKSLAANNATADEVSAREDAELLDLEKSDRMHAA